MIPKKTQSLLVLVSAFFLGVSLMAGCTYQYEQVAPQKRILYNNDVSSVAVLPFLNLSEVPGVVEETGEMFAHELARFREVKIVHPSSIEQYLAEESIQLSRKNIMQQARDIGSFFNVQTVIIGSVTEFEPYHPPVLGLSIVLLDVITGKVIDSRDVVYDSSFNYVRNELTEYAGLKNPSDTLLREDFFLHKCDKYIQFVCHQFIKKYL